MNKQQAIQTIAKSVRSKHPWSISQEKYLNLFGILPPEFLEERLLFNNLLEKSKQFTKCKLPLDSIKIEVHLSLDELIKWELNLDKWKDDVKLHNIYPIDIAKYLKDLKND